MSASVRRSSNGSSVSASAELAGVIGAGTGGWSRGSAWRLIDPGQTKADGDHVCDHRSRQAQTRGRRVEGSERMTETVAIVGSGLIGRAWAMIFARAGWTVRLYDPADGVAAAAVGLCATG